MENYTGNSNAGKPQQPKEEKKVLTPVTSNVTVKEPKKPSFFSKIFAQDIKSAGKGVANDVLLPGIKGLLVNLLKKTVDYIFLGSSAPTNSGYTNYSTPARHVTYAPGYNPNNIPTVPVARPNAYALNDIVFNERGEAEEVISRLNEIIKSYGMASVADFYDLINYKSDNHTANKYGWKDLSSAVVERSYEGYRIKFPKIIPLE